MPKYRAKSFKVILSSLNAVEAPSLSSGPSKSASLLTHMKSPTKKDFPVTKPINAQNI